MTPSIQYQNLKHQLKGNISWSHNLEDQLQSFSGLPKNFEQIAFDKHSF